MPADQPVIASRRPGILSRLGDSLRMQLLAWVTLTLVGAICVNLYLSYRSADATAALIVDRMLTAAARSIAEVVSASGGSGVEVPPAAIEMFDTGYRDDVFYQAITPWGRLVAGVPDLPRAPQSDVAIDVDFRTYRLRVMTLDHPMLGSDPDATISVTVGVTHRYQYALRRELWLRDFSEQVVLVLIAGLVTIFGLRLGLAPVLHLRDAVRERSRDRLDPLDPAIVQSELRPLVHTLNDYMDRVQAQMAAQRRFVANAAHQLRTPLAVIATQAGVAARETSPDRLVEALQALSTSTRHVTRLASQLLTLSRAEPGSRRPRADRIDLADVVREVLGFMAEEALRRRIDLGLEGDGAAMIAGDAPMIRELVMNLVDNALRYTPAGGRVTATVLASAGTVSLCVADNGPGIPAQERDQVFERFYRIAGTQAGGSGLGLAIVREIADGAGGTVTLEDSPAGGLTVIVKFPPPPIAADVVKAD